MIEIDSQTFEHRNNTNKKNNNNREKRRRDQRPSEIRLAFNRWSPGRWLLIL